MRPEDIDKLFRDKLEQHATPPPANLWYDLQEQLEPQEEKRRGGFWMYAVAAAITLLIVAGGGWLMWRTGLPTPGTSGSAPLASHSGKPASSSTPTTVTPRTSSTPAATGLGTEPGSQLTTPETPALAAQTEATGASAEATKPAVKVPKAKRREAQADAQLARVAAPARPASPQRQAAGSFQAAPADEQPALAAQPVQAPAPAVAVQSQAVAAATPAFGPIEVEVRQQPATTALASADATEPGRTRPRLVSVIKQVGRIARGEKPDLTEVGLPANPALTLQARVGNHTLSKTIEL
jgi:hypothetical protein